MNKSLKFQKSNPLVQDPRPPQGVTNPYVLTLEKAEKLSKTEMFTCDCE